MNAGIDTITVTMAIGTADAPDSRVDPDRGTVENARIGNIDAFETLVLRYQSHIVNYAAAVMRDSNDAEDVAQQTFLRAYRALAQFRGESTFKTWLYRIATNVALTHLNRRDRETRMRSRSLDDDTSSLKAFEIASQGIDTETNVVLRDTIDRALATLPNELRIAVILRDVAGLDYKEIADATGAPIGTVESRIFRGRQRLRPLLRPPTHSTKPERGKG